MAYSATEKENIYKTFKNGSKKDRIHLANKLNKSYKALYSVFYHMNKKTHTNQTPTPTVTKGLIPQLRLRYEGNEIIVPGNKVKINGVTVYYGV